MLNRKWKWPILALQVIIGLWCGLSGPLWGQNLQTIEGVVDLQNHDWHASPVVDLATEWQFLPNQFSRTWDEKDFVGRRIRLPLAQTHKGLDGKGAKYGEYRLWIVVDDLAAPPLALRIEECLTAYEVVLNGQLLGGRGKIGTMRIMAQPGYGPQIIPLPMGHGVWDLRIRVANFHHRRSGFQVVPQLGKVAALTEARQWRMVAGAVLIGLALMNMLFQSMHSLNRRRDRRHLYHALWSAGVVVHFLCLHERWMYIWLGEANWAWVYKLELVSVLGMAMAVAAFFHRYLREKQLDRIHWVIQSLLLAQILFVVFWPIHQSAQIDALMPFNLMGMIGYQIWLSARGIWRKERGSWILAGATLGLTAAAMVDGFMLDKHVGSLLTSHYAYVLFLVLMSWDMVRTTVQVERQVAILNQNLEETQGTLDMHTQAEEERTQAHQQALEQVRKQAETVASHHLVKMSLTRSLISDLEEMIRSGADESGALRSLLANLRGQLDTESRLEVWQQDLDVVNHDFFQRLAQQYPQLSKTEREICAYIRLNLSTKEMALIRKTTVNTLNVTRHRIRKKMGLERDEELAAALLAI